MSAETSTSKYTLVWHPVETWGLTVRNRVDTASETPLTEEERMIIALNTALIEARDGLTDFKP